MKRYPVRPVFGAPKPSAAGQPAPGQPSLFDESGPERRALTVSRFVALLNGTLRSMHPEAWVSGEISELKTSARGHLYFTLKDREAALPSMMWSDDALALPFRPEPGLSVVARGRPDVYAPQGRLSFVVKELVPAGAGALQLAYEQVRRRLAEEGLFELSRKRPLPLLPRVIGIVSSRQGAALRDVLEVLRVRFPNACVLVYPVAVQGASAPAEIARAIAAFSRARAADVVIVARGGGSREDLAAFNDERVVRAVAASAIPTISAVGHETDISLTDLAADVRAATPSQAAELVVARRADLEGRLLAFERRLAAHLSLEVSHARAELTGLAAGLDRFAARPERARLALEGEARRLLGAVRALPARFGEAHARAEGRLLAWPERAALPLEASRVEALSGLLRERALARAEAAAARLGELAGRLSALDPLAVLARGYAVAYREGETSPLTRADQTSPGETLRILLHEGEVSAVVSRVSGTSGESGKG